MLKVDRRNIRTRCEICSKLTIKTPERRQGVHSGVFVVNSEHISQFNLVFLSLTLSGQMPVELLLTVKILNASVHPGPCFLSISLKIFP